ncbi:MAG: hypothetical protein Q9209_001614 [Squamulea sp. 1 TL-2023]
MSLQLRTHTLGILCRLLLDHEVVIDHHLLHIIQDIISKILDNVEGDVDKEMTSMLVTIYRSVHDSGLQMQLLRHFPSSSSQQSIIRRRLALAFFFTDPTYLSTNKLNMLNIKRITQHLNQPRFLINSETDYPDLAAAIAILAIGLDNGDPPLVEESKEAITAFNDDLDMLAQRIKVLFTQIIASGASHMKRNEAKDVLELFYTCLVHAIRTKQKPKGMMWEDDVGAEKQKSLMKSFVQRDKAGSIMQLNGV